ncbi:MAG: SPFH domain-containing protein [Candidatus Dormiibacterota bacterium]
MSVEQPKGRISLADTPALVTEQPPRALSGWSALIVTGILFISGAGLLSRGLIERFHGAGSSGTLIGVGLLLLVLALVGLRGLTSVTPGEAVVLRLAGSYQGTVRRPGLWWVHPGSRRDRVSTRIRNHETGMLKVNDGDGNPIEIAAAVVWVVEDTARAFFAVDNYVEFVRVQAEAGVRHIASGYAYDTRGSDIPSLRENADEINEELSSEIATRVTAAGVRVVESRLTRLAYAPEIAQAMLRVQQANAVVAARHRIVEGAVGMVELALDRLSADAVIELDEERKATMVGNLLVVLCSDHDLQPVVNAGSLY